MTLFCRRTERGPGARPRRAVVFAAGLFALLIGVGGERASADIGFSEGAEQGGGPELEGRAAPFAVRTPAGARFQPERVVVLTLSATLSAPVPENGVAAGGDRLDLSHVPLFGELFGRQPATAVVEPERRVGVLFRDGDALVVDLRNAPVDADALLARPMALISTGLGARLVVVEARLDPEPARTAPLDRAVVPDGVVIGGAYLQGGARDGRLVLSPPRDTLFGW